MVHVWSGGLSGMMVGRSAEEAESVEIAPPSFSPGEMRVSYVGPITDRGIDRLLVIVEAGYSYYRVPKVEVQITSPGGSISALGTWLDTVRPLVAARPERVLATTAYRLCASAAALMFAHGTIGHRRVIEGTSLLFHDARVVVPGRAALTATASDALMTRLKAADGQLEERLLAHVAETPFSRPSRALLSRVGMRCTTLNASVRRRLLQRIRELDEPFANLDDAVALGLADAITPSLRTHLSR